MPSAALTRLSPTVSLSFQRVVSHRELRHSSSCVSIVFGQCDFSGSLRYLSSRWEKRNGMAASGTKAVAGEVYVDGLISSNGNAVDFTKPSGVFFDRGRRSFERGSVSTKRKVTSETRLICGYNIYDVTWRNRGSNSFIGQGPHLRTFRTFTWTNRDLRAASDVFEGGMREDSLTSSATSVGQVVQGGKPLNLLSGSCSLPHPDKEDKGGEDAHFICPDEQVIGVADGVGGWADVGVDAGLFSRELMSNAVDAIKEDPDGVVDPLRVLEKAHSKTKAKGSSTACIITLKDEAIHAINLGDSGFIVVRDGCTIFRSPVQQHGFNFTYQLESGSSGDLPSSGEVFTIPVSAGDVIVAGTDGLFDNLYNNEIAAVIVDAMRSGLEPQATAQKIAALARHRAVDRSRQTPFATAAQEAGFRYYGGKLDDITVVVSFVTKSGD
ncbi:hypothetical protein MLD38_028641 [Melastoma candidum]|uniref:Uncharacterized protein n=1 Tax=Melastoma candidum TaxID=119954 RepID=A0ACB9N1A4_9MYRT|nr:hypothetical protein MLD38_028641 [Melastoma candidum]